MNHALFLGVIVACFSSQQENVAYPRVWTCEEREILVSYLMPQQIWIPAAPLESYMVIQLSINQSAARVGEQKQTRGNAPKSARHFLR